MFHTAFRGFAVLVLAGILGTPLDSWTFLARAWEKNGCSVDPFGRCLDGSRTATDNGCRVDPDGGCTSGR
ncbi:MAG TPA: hypothetical protein VHC97_15100 [Thermoanaerobaculia bacterium]|jgi:hypothetical protein|nr:hypothetical protein [Thermoanaerobaculia bacterium]